MTTPTEPTPTTGHNQPPADTLIFAEIIDLFDEATNWADGEAIASQEMHDQITILHDSLHDAGKRAEALREVEKTPILDAGKAVEAKYKPYSTKVSQGKRALADLLGKWRQRVAAEKAAEARRKADLAAAEMAAAQAAIRESRGNLLERVSAEEHLTHAQTLEKVAKRADKEATTGLGLRTIWHVELDDSGAALDWAYSRDAGAFDALALRMAETAVRAAGGLRAVPGFKVWSEQVAR